MDEWQSAADKGSRSIYLLVGRLRIFCGGHEKNFKNFSGVWLVISVIIG
jgi:hypothetical protein